MHSFGCKIKVAAAALVVLGSIAQAGISYHLEDFESKGLTNTVGILSKDGGTFLKDTISKDFSLGPFEIGSDINLAVPMTSGYQTEVFVALRKIKYDYNNQFGVTWGRLSKVTFGYGLLMDDYDSAMGGDSIEYTSQKGGVLGYATYNNVKAQALWTPNHMNAYRASYTLEDSMIMGSSIVFGANYVNDSDGVDEVGKKAQQGYGADIGLPIAGDFLTLYTEYAQLSKSDQVPADAKAGSAGLKGEVGPIGYRFEYRKLGTGFIPSYFNETYEALAAPAAPGSELSGFLGSVNSELFDGYFKAGLMYEKYDNVDLFSAAVGWKEVNHTVGVINYSRPLGNGSGAAVADAEILYLTGSALDYEVHIKRVYAADGTFDETYTVGARMNLSKLFSLPF